MTGQVSSAGKLYACTVNEFMKHFANHRSHTVRIACLAPSEFNESASQMIAKYLTVNDIPCRSNYRNTWNISRITEHQNSRQSRLVKFTVSCIFFFGVFEDLKLTAHTLRPDVDNPLDPYPIILTVSMPAKARCADKKILKTIMHSMICRIMPPRGTATLTRIFSFSHHRSPLPWPKRRSSLLNNEWNGYGLQQEHRGKVQKSLSWAQTNTVR